MANQLYEIELPNDATDNRLSVVFENEDVIYLNGDEFGIHFPTLSMPDAATFVSQNFRPVCQLSLQYWFTKLRDGNVQDVGCFADKAAAEHYYETHREELPSPISTPAYTYELWSTVNDRKYTIQKEAVQQKDIAEWTEQNVLQTIPRSCGLQLLDRLDSFRRDHQHDSADHAMRCLEGLVAQAFGYTSRSEWTDALKKQESAYARYIHPPTPEPDEELEME